MVVESKPSFFRRIARFVRGQWRDTPMNADRMNEIVDLLNALGAMDGKNGVRVIRAQAGYAIVLDDTVRQKLNDTNNPQAGEGFLRFQGEWNSTDTYEVNDVVIYRTSGAISSGTKAGTYCAIVRNTNVEPVEAAAASQATWRTLAKGAWDRLLIKNADGQYFDLASGGGGSFANVPATYGWSFSNVELDFLNSARSGNLIEVRSFGGVDGGAYAQLTHPSTANYVALLATSYFQLGTGGGNRTILLELGALTAGQVGSFREVQYKDENGDTKKRRFLCTDVYA